GLELPVVIGELHGYPAGMLLREAGWIIVCVTLVRMIWVVPSTYVGRWIGGHFPGAHDPPPPFRLVALVGWTGLRGGDSVVIALALPRTTATGAPFPARGQIVFISFAVVCVTLVVQGLTIAPLARRLRLHGDRREEEEEIHARLAAA